MVQVSRFFWNFFSKITLYFFAKNQECGHYWGRILLEGIRYYLKFAKPFLKWTVSLNEWMKCPLVWYSLFFDSPWRSEVLGIDWLWQFRLHGTVKVFQIVRCTHIGSLFWLTLQSVGINRMRTYTDKVYFAISFNRLSCQFAENF